MFTFLVLNVGTDRRLVPPDRRDEVATRAEMLTGEIALALIVGAGQVDGALAFDQVAGDEGVFVDRPAGEAVRCVLGED